MGRRDAGERDRGIRGAHRAEPSNGGRLATIGHVLGSTVPKRVPPPRLFRVLLFSGVMVGLLLFGYSTSQIYLRFTEPPIDRDSSALPSPGTGRSAEPEDTSISGTAGPGPTAYSAGPESRPDNTAVPAEPRDVGVSYRITESTETDFTGQLAITNTGTETLDQWELVVSFADARVTAVREAEWRRTGGGVLLRPPHWEGGIPPGETRTVDLTVEGAPQRPIGCALNGQQCRLQ